MSLVQRNNVKVIGNGPRTLFLAHGYGSDQTMWHSVVPAFEDKYTIVLFDYVGAGLSDARAFDQTRYSTLRGYAKDVLEIIEDLKLKQVDFIGHSVSSMIGALAAIEQPDHFANLIMIGPSPRYINEGSYFGGFEQEDIDGLLDQLEANHVGWSVNMAPVIMGYPERPELAAELEGTMRRTNPTFAQSFARATFLSDHRADLPKITTRTLILQSEHDPIAPMPVGKYVHTELPSSQYVLIESHGHCPHMSAPEKVIPQIQRFLEPSFKPSPN